MARSQMATVLFNPERTDQTWRQKTADQVVVKSKLELQIGRMSLSRRGLLFAEYCLASYLPQPQIEILAKQRFGLDECLLDVQGNVALAARQTDWSISARRFQNYEDCTVVLAMNESPRWSELCHGLVRPPVLAETKGYEQPVIKQLADKIWPALETALRNNYRPLRFIGHGVAGAVAAICANRCLMSYIRSEPLEIHTYGSPRWGDPAFHRTHRVYHYRWVLPTDPVSELPPAWLGYRHYGEQMTIDDTGRRRKQGIGHRLLDQVRAWRLSNSKQDRPIQPDHAIARYVDALYEYSLRTK